MHIRLNLGLGTDRRDELSNTEKALQYATGVYGGEQIASTPEDIVKAAKIYRQFLDSDK